MKHITVMASELDGHAGATIVVHEGSANVVSYINKVVAEENEYLGPDNLIIPKIHKSGTGEISCYIETSLLDLNCDEDNERFYLADWNSLTVNQDSDVLSTNGFTSSYSESFSINYAPEISIVLDLTFSLNLIYFMQNDLLFLEETDQPTIFISASVETTGLVSELTDESSNIGLHLIVGIGLVFVIILVMGRKR